MSQPKLQPNIIVLASPAGGGKTTQRKNLLKEPGSNREFLVSYTTRPPRSDEKDGVDYHFVTPDAFAKLKSEGKLFESTYFYGNHYGTPKAQLLDGLAADKQMIADVNLEGITALRGGYPNRVTTLFLMPPSLEELACRLRDRDINSQTLDAAQRAQAEATIRERMSHAADIIRQGEKMHHMRLSDYYIIRSQATPEATFERIQGILRSQRSIPSNIVAGGGTLTKKEAPVNARAA